MKDGINELIRQRALFLMESEKLLEDPVLVLANRVRVLTWVIVGATLTQVGLRLF